MNLDDAIREALELKETVEDFRTRRNEAQKRLDELVNRLIPDLMEQSGHVKPDGSGSVTHASGARVHLRHEVFASVLAADQPRFFTWLREHGAGDLIKETVHAGTLKSWAKEQLENGAEIPDVVKVNPLTVAIITKPKGPDL